MKINKMTRSIQLAMPVLLLSSPGLLQAADTGESLSLEEIVVTARGREQTLQDVSVAVSVASGDLLERENIKTLQDVSSRMGNVKITTGSLVNSMNIRGAGSGENPGFEQAVATFADGVYRSRSRSTMAALFDVDRVEVIKGPQSTFFGANAVAGALNITSRKPGQEFGYNVTGLYGADGEYNLEAGVTLPVNDELSVRVAGRFSGMDGYVQTPNGEGPDEQNKQARVYINWQPNDVWESNLRIDVVDAEIDNHAPFELLNCAPAAEYTSYPFAPSGAPHNCFLAQALNPDLEDDLNWKSDSEGSWQTYEFLEVAFTNTWDIDAGTLRAITAYSDQENDSFVNLIPVPIAGTPQGFSGLPNNANEKYEFMSQEVRFESDTEGFMNYMVGLYYSKGSLDYVNGITGFHFVPWSLIFGNTFAEITPDTGVAGNPSSYIDDETLSAFWSSTLNVTDQFRTNLGLRYSRVEKEGHRNLTVGSTINGVEETFVEFQDPNAQAAVCSVIGCSQSDYVVNKIKDSKLMPSVGFEFDVDDNSMIYLNYSKGFKAGGFSTTSTPSVFGPEDVDAFELGLKGVYLDGRLNMNVALFTMDYSGLQETVYDANLASSIANAAKSTSQGAEVGFTWHANNQLSFTADWAYLDAFYEDYPNGDCTKLQVVNSVGACTQDMSGKRRGYAPEWSGSLGATARFAVADSLELRISPTLSYSDDYFMTATADPLFEQSSYTKVDMNIGLGSDDGSWEVSLIGRNLTDEAVTAYRLGTPGADGSLNALTERGRSVALQFVLKH